MVNFFKVILVWSGVCFVIVFTALWKGLSSLLFAWVLNLMLMIGVLHSTETYLHSLRSSWFNTKKWESQGKIYTLVGVNFFRKLLVWTGWEKLNKARNPVDKRSEALLRLEFNTRKSELGHLIILFFVGVISLFVVLRYGLEHAFWLIILNVLLNLYPIFVQRYNRPRIQKLIENL